MPPRFASSCAWTSGLDWLTTSVSRNGGLHLQGPHRPPSCHRHLFRTHAPTHPRHLLRVRALPYTIPVRRFRSQGKKQEARSVSPSPPSTLRSRSDSYSLSGPSSPSSRACLRVGRACSGRNNTAHSPRHRTESPLDTFACPRPSSPRLAARGPSRPLAVPPGLAWSSSSCTRSLFAEGALLVATCTSNDKRAVQLSRAFLALHSSHSAAPRVNRQTS